MLKRAISILLIVALLPLLAACSMLFGRPLEGINLAIIIGTSRANSYWLTSADFDLIEEQLRRAFTSTQSGTLGTTTFGARANIWVILSDGNPQAIELRRPLSVNGAANGTDRDAEIDNLIAGIMSDLRNRNFTMSRHPEADLFQAKHVGADLLRQASQRDDGPSTNYLLIFDSGISTSGRINMANGFDIQTVNLNASDGSPFSDILEPIVSNGLLPDLNGVNTIFHGIGGLAAYPQVIPADSSIFRGQLIGLWEEVLNLSGANVLSIQWGVRGTVANMSFEPNPYIKEINFPFVTPVFFHDVNMPGQPRTPWERMLLPRETVADEYCAFSNGGLNLFHEWLGFRGDSEEFYNSVRALEIIEYVATHIRPFLKNNPHSTLYIVGSVARVRLDRDNTGTLSHRRAERVASILIDHFGIPAENLVVIGANTTIFPWRNAQEFPDGVWSETNARQNRVVAIIPDTSERFRYLQESGFVN